MKIAVIDIQGAGIGQTVIKKIRKEIGNNIYIIALGINTFASSNMVKSGADVGISGEKSILTFCRTNQLDSIIGPIQIICNEGINHEFPPTITNAILSMDCTKYILPLKKHNIYIPGTRNFQIKDMIEEIVLDLKKHIY